MKKRAVVKQENTKISQQLLTNRRKKLIKPLQINFKSTKLEATLAEDKSPILSQEPVNPQEIAQIIETLVVPKLKNSISVSVARKIADILRAGNLIILHQERTLRMTPAEEISAVIKAIREHLPEGIIVERRKIPSKCDVFCRKEKVSPTKTKEDYIEELLGEGEKRILPQGPTSGRIYGRQTHKVNMFMARHKDLQGQAVIIVPENSKLYGIIKSERKNKEVGRKDKYVYIIGASEPRRGEIYSAPAIIFQVQDKETQEKGLKVKPKPPRPQIPRTGYGSWRTENGN